jgi:hypothetical protein
MTTVVVLVVAPLLGSVVVVGMGVDEVVVWCAFATRSSRSGVIVSIEAGTAVSVCAGVVVVVVVVVGARNGAGAVAAVSDSKAVLGFEFRV